MWRLGVKANSVMELLRMRRFNSIVASGLVPRTWPTAVEIGPPLVTINTCCP
jgi:hypothetical protein